MANKPNAYKSKNVIFRKRCFFIQEGTHIPRLSTEFISKYYINSIKELNRRCVVADIGTGSGVLAISVALECPNASVVYATDLFDKPIRVTNRNIQNFNLNKKVKTLKGDLFKPLLNKKIDVIIANLPFADDAKISNLRPEVKEFEPIEGIYGGKNGFELYEKLFLQLSTYKHFRNIKCLWIFCNKDHLNFVQYYKSSLFKQFKMVLIEDKYKSYYQHVQLYR